ncbi:winged helix-turn-helix transcriptional regulator [Amycolatopsis thermoflava]|uniref:winged helix-turn-helix transcriptional regulator n=1 Tax=Amycolatopsis thermoflava TaxID=84480 RepID=UPI003F49DF4E
MATGDTGYYLDRWRDLRHLLNGEWIIHVLVTLNAGPLHYKQLYEAIQESSTFDPWSGSIRRISGRALGRTLRRLEAGGLVVRTEERVFPRSVVYSITPAAVDLLAKARAVMDWAEEHPELFEQLRKAQSDNERDQRAWSEEPDEEDE